jgi:hypothetical protein
MTKSPGFFGIDMDEVRRSAAGITITARNYHAVVLSQGLSDTAKPRGECARIQSILVYIFGLEFQ